jgi:hypothetical protein
MTTLAGLIAFADEMIAAEIEIEKLTARVSLLKNKLLPDMFEELGIKFIGSSSGHMVEINRNIAAAISNENSAKACMWLRDNGHGSIIKNTVGAQFGADEDKAAEEAQKLLTEAGFEATRVQNVHHSTLTALVKELLKDGKDVPMSLLGVRDTPTTKVTAPRKL